MRILLNGMLLGGYFSGVEVTISGLARALREFGRHSYVCVSPAHAGLDIDQTDAFKLHSVNPPTRSRVSRIAWEHLRLPGLTRDLNCDILHCPGYVAPFSVSVPTVLTVHDCFALNNPEWCKPTNRLYYNLIFRRSLRRAAAVLVPSGFVKRELTSSFSVPERKIRIVPFAAADRFSAEADAYRDAEVKCSLRLPDRYVLFVGNAEPKKNLPGALKAFARFAASGEKAKGHHLVIVGGGGGWGVDLDREIRESSVADRIHRLGHVPLVDLPSVYRLADCLLFPSFSEGFGLPVVEAMACGIPVAASNRGALPETVADAGILAAPDDVEANAANLAALAFDRGRRRHLSEKGSRRARDFSWRKTAELTDDVYESVAREAIP